MSKNPSKSSKPTVASYKRQAGRDTPLATQLSIVALSRILRPVLGRAQRFVAAAVVPPETNIYHYNAAAHLLLEAQQETPKFVQEHDVIVVTNSADLDKLIRATKDEATRRVIILLATEELLTPGVSLLCDLVSVLPKPSARDIKIAATRMGFGRIKDDVAEFMALQDIGRLSLVMRQGRSVDAMIARLRRHPPTETPVVATVETVPTLHDLHGLGSAKRWGLELAVDIADWKAGTLKWSEVDRGMLLSGRPGCGKTSYATALARTCGVNLVSASAAKWQSTGHLGDMLKAMRQDFDEAVKSSPSILFIDEFDSFPNRQDLVGDNASYARQVVNGLLEALDGAKARDGVVVIGATNFPELIDDALLRPGRLERHFVIPLPDGPARAGIFRYHLREDLASTSIDFVVGKSQGWTGADIERCVRDARRLARRKRQSMEIDDLIASMPARVKVPLDFLRSVAVHELGHAIVGVNVDADRLISVTIEDSIDPKSSLVSLGDARFNEEPISRKTSTYFENRIAVLMAGMAAERIVFGDHSSGAAGHRQGDLNQATDIATMMEVTWGFGKTLTSEVLDKYDDLARIRMKRQGLARVVEETLRKQLVRAETILTEHRDALDRLTETLMTRRFLSAEEIATVVWGHGREDVRSLPRTG